MAEFAPFNNYEASDPSLVIWDMPDIFLGGPSGSFTYDFYETSDPSLWRVRYFNVVGTVGAGPGSGVLSLGFFTSGLIGDPWPSGGPFIGASSVQIPPNKQFSFTWSTDIADNYSNPATTFGTVAVMGLPLMFIPGRTTLELQMDTVGGTLTQVTFDAGNLQIEKFPRGSTQGGQGGSLENVYLLPTTI